MTTICLVHFKTMPMASLEAAVWSLRQQDLSRIDEIVIVDNNSDALPSDIYALTSTLYIRTRVISSKHQDLTRTHAWATNLVVAQVESPWFLMTRSDYLLASNTLEKFHAVIDAQPSDWNGFVTGDGSHLTVPLGECERLGWRQRGVESLGGSRFDYTLIDAGVWMMRRAAFDKIEGLNEGLAAWGHSQTEFQYRLYASGVDFIRVPEVLFVHPLHAGERDIAKANEQLAASGGDLKNMWDRYHGVSPY